MPDDRIYLTAEQTDAIEREVELRRCVERYAIVRRHLFGRVLDAGCGAGYGSWLCAKNPDVEFVVGIDEDPSAIEWARSHFETQKTAFFRASIDRWTQSGFDVLMSLETIDRLERPAALAELAERAGVSEVLLSFPQNKTTHADRSRRWDVVEEDARRLFSGFAPVDVFSQDGEHLVMRMVRARARRHAAKRFPGFVAEAAPASVARAERRDGRAVVELSKRKPRTTRSSKAGAPRARPAAARGLPEVDASPATLRKRLAPAVSRLRAAAAHT